MAEKAKETAEHDREFAASEKRYEDRRDAVVAFQKAALDEQDAIVRYEYDYDNRGFSPGDIHDDYQFDALNEALAAVELLATDDVIDAANAVRDAVVKRFSDPRAQPVLRDSLAAYKRASRLMLGTAGTPTSAISSD
ncbi:hypothetical protein GCM10022261_02730 [Brevibacterium daeguense]|uniref:Uncharacterized protein n=2 Tax=Brevibacterium daeguense TaxID=909936 RepID=A0ABP8EFK8_9MICO